MAPFTRGWTWLPGSVAVAVVLLAARLDAATPAVLVGPDLRPRPVNLQSIAEGTVTYFDEKRVYRSEPLGQVLQVRSIGGETEAQQPPPPAGAEGAPPLPAGGEAAAEPAAAAATSPEDVLELVDGQRLRGEWAGAGDDGETLRWRDALLGDVTVPLNSVRALRRSGSDSSSAGGAQAEAGGDVVVLANGDVLEGFVRKVTPQGLDVRLEQGRALTVPLARVRELRLANPAAPAARRTHLVSFDDGSRLAAASLSVSDDVLELRAAPPFDAAVSVPLEDVERIDLAGEAGRLVELADLPLIVTEGGEVFGLPTRPRVEAGALRLHAPMAVELALPDGARRLAARAAIDAAAGDAHGVAWADFELVLSVEGQEVGRWRLNESQTAVDMNAEIDGATLTIELLPGVNGPIFDRLKLVDAVVLAQ